MFTFFRFRAARKVFLTAMMAPLCLLSLALPYASAELQVGTAVADIAPTKLPVLITGGFLGRTADTIRYAPLPGRWSWTTAASGSPSWWPTTAPCRAS